jgi:hypothetical protein
MWRRQAWYRAARIGGSTPNQSEEIITHLNAAVFVA